ncbi:MAG: hypothetical protein H7247_16015 [Polaromonas sp.]|nr:hypothetical protein [Gemmatimonadaceae bacterium]
MKQFFTAATLLAVPFASAFAYPKAKLHNRAPYGGTVTINYAACKRDVFRVGASRLDKQGVLHEAINEPSARRGACLITSISATLDGAGRPVTTYTSSGTGYSKFIIAPTGDDFRVYSDAELARENAATREGKSPGFFITNKTMWPVSIAIEQVGCLYYGTLKPNETFNRNTGAVWFTLKANIAADGKEPRTDWDCVKPVAAIVGAVVVAAATGGAAAFAALPAAGGFAAGMGALALAPLVTSSAVIVGSAAAGAGVVAAGSATALAVGRALEANGGVTLAGQYAGPDWPFRCDAKPTYEIRGGWGKPGYVVSGKDSSYAVDSGTPMRIVKTNTCGDQMMR